MTYRSFLVYVVLSAVFLALAVIAGMEFYNLPFSGTWGSDAQYYYLAAVGKGGEQSCSAYLGYGYVCVFTAFISVLNVPIVFYALIGLLYLFIAFRYYLPRDEYTSPLIWGVLVFNPIVVWTFLKGVKEGFVITCLLILVKIYGKARRRLRTLDLLLFVCSIFALSTVKFEAVAFVGMAAILTEIVMRANNKMRTAVILLGSAVMLLFVLDQLGKLFPEIAFIQKLMAHKELFFNEEISDPDANVNYFIAIFRFLLGPGPITPISSLFQDTGFYEPTSLGKILIFWGSICWLATFLLFILGIVKILSCEQYREGLSRIVTKEVVLSALMGALYTLTYAYMYGGMVDTRHRAVVYVLVFPLLAPIASLGARYFFPKLKWPDTVANIK